MSQYARMFDTTGIGPGFGDGGEGDEALAMIVAGLELLRAEERAGWSSAARSSRVLEVAHAAERLNSELVRAVAAGDGHGDYAADGSLSATAWLTHRIPCTHASAARLVSASRLTRRSTRIEKALDAGDMTVDQVEQIAKVIRNREDIFATHGDVLVDAAHELPPEQFRTAAARWRALADDELGRCADPHDTTRNELTLSPTLG